MGSYRIGVSQTLVVRAIAEATNIDAASIAHRIMGKWLPGETDFESLLMRENVNDDASRPYPFFLAYAIEDELEDLGEPDEWIVEWKWDGIRSQIIYRNNELFIWTRGEELATDKFPELHFLKSYLHDGTVLDGEIVSFQNGKPLPFNVLQTRIGRKNLTKKILEEAAVTFLAYDILEYNGEDIRTLQHIERRIKLEEVILSIPTNERIQLSPIVVFSTWQQLRDLHLRAREFVAEGFMIKRKTASYQVGRKKRGLVEMESKSIEH